MSGMKIEQPHTIQWHDITVFNNLFNGGLIPGSYIITLLYQPSLSNMFHTMNTCAELEFAIGYTT
jgi:hypothetical protein